MFSSIKFVPRISLFRSHINKEGFVDPRIQVSKTAFDLGIIAAGKLNTEFKNNEKGP